MKLAADANVLLSATAGHAASRVFDASVEVLTTEGVVQEVVSYLPDLAREYDLDPTFLAYAFRALRLTALPPAVYAGRLEEARRRIGKRDPDDADLLALALALDIPVWSNDDDFRHVGVEWFTTARLLAKLGVRGKDPS